MLLADTPDAAQRLVSSLAPKIVVGREDIARSIAGGEATLGVVAEDRDELCAIIGFGAQGLVRDDDRRPRQCGRRDAIEHFARDRDAVKRAIGIVAVVDRYRTPAQTPAFPRHRCEYMRADRLAWIADLDRNLDARIEHFAAISYRLACGASHVELLRRTADVDRDRFEREICLVRGPGRVDLLDFRRLRDVLCGVTRVEPLLGFGTHGVELLA